MSGGWTIDSIHVPHTGLSSIRWGCVRAAGPEPRRPQKPMVCPTWLYRNWKKNPHSTFPNILVNEPVGLYAFASSLMPKRCVV